MAEYTEKVNFQVGFEDASARKSIDLFSKKVDDLDSRFSSLGKKDVFKGITVEFKDLNTQMQQLDGESKTIKASLSGMSKDSRAGFESLRDAIKTVQYASKGLSSSLSASKDSSDVTVVTKKYEELYNAIKNLKKQASSIDFVPDDLKSTLPRVVEIANSSFDNLYDRVEDFAHSSDTLSTFTKQVEGVSDAWEKAISSFAKEVVSSKTTGDLTKAREELEKLYKIGHEFSNLGKASMLISPEDTNDMRAYTKSLGSVFKYMESLYTSATDAANGIKSYAWQLAEAEAEAGSFGDALSDGLDIAKSTGDLSKATDAMKGLYKVYSKFRDIGEANKLVPADESDYIIRAVSEMTSRFEEFKKQYSSTVAAVKAGDFGDVDDDFQDISSNTTDVTTRVSQLINEYRKLDKEAEKAEKATKKSIHNEDDLVNMQEAVGGVSAKFKALSASIKEVGETGDEELDSRLTEMLRSLEAEEQKLINLQSKRIRAYRVVEKGEPTYSPKTKEVEQGTKSAASSARFFVNEEKRAAAAEKAAIASKKEQEAEKARIAQLEAQEAAEKRAASAQKGLTEAFDEYIQKAGVAPFNKILSEVENLEYSFVGLKQKYEQMFKSGDFSGLQEANNELKEMRASAASAQQQLQSGGFAGIDTSGLQQRLTTLQGGISSLAKSSSKELSVKLGAGFKTATDTLWKYGQSAAKSIYDYSKKLVSAWGNVLSSVFGKVISGWKSALGSVFSSNKGGGNTLLSQLLGVASIAGLASIGKQAITTASDLMELDNVIDVVFKDSASNINDFADNVAMRFGLTSNAAKEMAGSFGAILGASNITGDAQREMSKNLVALSGDLASFYNKSTDEMATKLQSALVGNADAVRELGVIMTETNLKAYALQSGITQDYDSLNEATKATLRYNYVLNQMKNAQGDFAATSYSWANQVRTLSNNFKQLLSILGGGIIKALYPSLTILNQIVSAAINAANALARIFHFQPVDIKTLLGGGDSGSSAVQDFASDLGSVADGMDNVADSTAKANENLQSFDKINNISTQTDSGSSKGGSGASGAGGAGGGSLIDFDSYYENVDALSEKPINERLKKILDTLKRFANDIASVDYSKFIKSWKNMIKSFTPIVDDLGNSIVWLWDNVLLPFYKWSVTAGAPAVFDLVAAGAEALHEIILAVSPAIDDFWKETLAPFFGDLGDSFVAKVNSWTDALKAWTNELKNAPDKVEFLKQTFQDLKQQLYDWIDDTGITDRLDSIGEHLKSIFDKVFSGDANGQLTTLTKAFAELNVITFDNIIGLIDRLTGNEEVTSFIDFLVGEFGDLADVTFDAIGDIIEKISSSESARDIVTNISDAIENIVNWVDSHTDQILALLDGASTAAAFLSEHLDAVAVAIGVIGAAQGISVISDKLGLVSTLASGLPGEFGALAGLISPAGILAAVVAGIVAFKPDLFGALMDLLTGTVTWLGENLPMILEALGAFVQRILDNLPTVINDLLGKLPELITAVSEFLKGAIPQIVAAATELLGGIVEALPSIIQSLVASLPELITSVVQFLISSQASIAAGAWQLVWGVIKLLPTWFKTLFTEIIPELWGGIWETLVALAEQFGGWLSEIVGKIAEWGKSAWDTATEWVSNIVDSVVEWFSGLPDKIEYAIGFVIGKLVEWARNVKQWITENLPVIIKNVVDFFAQLPTKVKEKLDSVIAKIKSWGTDMKNKASSTGREFLNNVVNGIKDLPRNIKDKLTDAYNKVVDFARDLPQKGKEAAEDLFNNIVDGISGLPDKMYEIGDNIVSGIWDGIDGAVGWISGKVSGFCDNVLDGFKDALGIHSPSRVMRDKVGKFITLGLADGITSEEGYLIDSVDDLASNMVSAFDDTSFDMSDLIDMTKFSSLLSNAENDFNEFLSNVDNKSANVKFTTSSKSFGSIPSIRRNELAAIASQSSSTRAVTEGISALYAQASKTASSTNKMVHVTMELKGKPLADFVIDTVRGDAIQTGKY